MSRTWIAAAASAFLAAVLPACDIVNLPEIKPGITTQAEVRSRMGEPGFIHWDNDGSATWEYSRQPEGTTCYMIGFGQDQVVRHIEQVLVDTTFNKISAGLSKDDVRRLLGKPGKKRVFDNLGEEIWAWRIEGVPPMEETWFEVYFDLGHGAVKKTGRRVEQKG